CSSISSECLRACGVSYRTAPIVSTTAECVRFVLDLNPRFSVGSDLTPMSVDYWAFPVVSLGPAVISSHRFETLEITMKTLILAAIRCSLLFLVPSIIYGSSAQWDLDPISGDWNTAVNWTPDSVPNGPADIATFGLSNMTDVSISEDTEVKSIIFTPAATNPYSITVNAGLTLTVSGVGIKNNSGVNQTLTTVSFPERSAIRFT